MVKLNLGCGNDYRRGYLNCDSSKRVKKDKFLDLEKSLPFEDDSVEEILANHVLEHVQNFNKLVIEMHRILKKGALLKVRVPFYAHFGAFMDPTHKRFFTPFTFDYFADSPFMYETTSTPLFQVKVKLKFLFRRSLFNKVMSAIVNSNHKIYCRFFAWVCPVAEISFELKVLK